MVDLIAWSRYGAKVLVQFDGESLDGIGVCVEYENDDDDLMVPVCALSLADELLLRDWLNERHERREVNRRGEEKIEG